MEANPWSSVISTPSSGPPRTSTAHPPPGSRGLALVTVRLTPSTVIDPFSTTYRASSFGTSISMILPGGASLISLTVPTPSTCPWTRCPPRRDSRVTGLSRLTGSPDDSEARELRVAVSGERSNASVIPSPLGERSTTVRHTPLTASDAPGPESTETFEHATRKREPGSTTTPRSSTIPVNIRHHLQVLTDRLDRSNADGQRVGDRGHAVAAQHSGGRRATEQLGRQVQD